MLMDNETIVTLYREAVDNGDPKEIINSMAKTNGCSPGEIRQILNDAGEFVPRQKRGRPKAAGSTAEAVEIFDPAKRERYDWDKLIELAEGKEETKRVGNMSAPEAAGNEPERQLPLPDAVKKCIMKGLDDIEKEIKKKQEELAILEAEYNTITEYMKT